MINATMIRTNGLTWFMQCETWREAAEAMIAEDDRQNRYVREGTSTTRYERAFMADASGEGALEEHQLRVLRADLEAGAVPDTGA